jgi:uroporphyrinogen decarboxylase
MLSLSPRERVKRFFAREQPDRVPVNYCANAGIDRRLKEHFGLAANDGEGLLRALGVDFRGVGAPYVGPKLHADIPGRHVDNRGVRTRWIEHGSGGYWDFCDFPLKDATLDQVEAWPLPSPDHYDYSTIPAQCERHGDFAIFVGNAGVGDIINSTGMIRSQEQVLIDLIEEDPAGMRLIDRKIDHDCAVLERTLHAARGRIDFVWMGEDLGTQIGPMVSLDLYRRILRPRHQRLIDIATAFSLPVLVHCCGSSSWAFEDFIEMGVVAVDTLQPEAKNMSPVYLKEHFGGRLGFHGAISTAGPVSFGSAEETARNVRETLETLMPGGGYAFAPTHALQDNSPTANVVAMYDAARQYGRYDRG